LGPPTTSGSPSLDAAAIVTPLDELQQAFKPSFEGWKIKKLSSETGVSIPKQCAVIVDGQELTKS